MRWIVFLLLAVAALASGVYCVARKSHGVAERERVARQVEQQIALLKQSIHDQRMRLVRLERDAELNVLVARDKTRRVREGELLLILADPAEPAPKDRDGGSRPETSASADP